MATLSVSFLLVSLLWPALAIVVPDGYTAGNAVIDQEIDRIGVSTDISMGDFAETGLALTGEGTSPYTLTRSITVYNAADDGVVPTVDLAYTGHLLQLAPGVTLTYQGIRISRAEAGVPFGQYASSDGSAAVVLDGTAEHLEVCPPSAYAAAYFLSAGRRPVPGSNQASFQGDVWHMDDVAISVPVTSNNLGGYMQQWKNGATIECGHVLDLPSACSELASSTASISAACEAAVAEAMREAVCQQSGSCINGCAASCGSQARRRTRRRWLTHRH